MSSCKPRAGGLFPMFQEHRPRSFEKCGSCDATVVSGPRDDRPFYCGACLKAFDEKSQREWGEKQVEMYGRVLVGQEEVHHIDGCKDNNIPGNIHICSSDWNHIKLHEGLEALSYTLFKDGVIGFKDGEYYIKSP